MKPVVVVTGASGQLGEEICRTWADGYTLVPLSRARLDVTDPAAVKDAILTAQPQVIVNCTAYNQVDAAESDARSALAINAIAVRTLARVAQDAAAVLVHYSTDFVFDGNTDRPYREDDPTSPLSIYAQSKLVGEWFASSHPRVYVLRVASLFGGSQRRGNIDRFIESLRAGRSVTAFSDREASPSFIPDVAAATRSLLEREAPWGVYHCVNSGHASWFAIAHEVARQLGSDATDIKAQTVAQVTAPAARPRYAALDNSRLRNVGVRMPAWQDAIARLIQLRFLT